MSCYTTAKSSVTMDVEDLVLDSSKQKVDIIQKNTKIYEVIVETIWNAVVIDQSIQTRDDFTTLYQKLLRKYRVSCKKNVLSYTYKNMVKQGLLKDSPIVHQYLQTKPTRNMSGVTVITVLTSPYPNGQNFSCRHNCYYCPAEPNQPRSYLKKEPAVARANDNHFDPILQTASRLKALLLNGHEIDKLEFIIEGGTYTEYPPAYLERFHRDLIYCVNTYFDKKKRSPMTIEQEIKANADATIKIIGICIETRPDTLIDDKGISWLPRFRKWGVTRVQLGVQHTNNKILKKVNRGHTIGDSVRAINHLKNNGFKIDIHLMPDLPGSSPKKDRDMFKKVFQPTMNNVFPVSADQIKIYPCEVVPWTVIQKKYRDGKYIPYSEKNERDLFEVVKEGMMICPPWIRLPRVIRDIPLTYIEGGNRYPNLRQMLEDEIKRDGTDLMEIRARECARHPTYKWEDAELVTRTFFSSDFGREYFLSFESPDKKCIFGFLRLRIRTETGDHACVFPEIKKNCALIREVHIYGSVTPVGNSRTQDRAQHRGFGKRLIQRAETIAAENGCASIAVIQGMGVVRYYEKLGYQLVDHFMIKQLSRFDYHVITMNILTIFFVLYISLIAHLCS